ncbi:MAG: flagellar basal-body MS-ring/collar protein FliF [Anaerolineae bacterium]
MGILQKINAVWQKIGVVQRALLIAMVLACVITAGLLTRWASSADMRLLYSDLSAEDAGKIVDKISEMNVPYELRGNGTSIYVPSKEVYRLRLAMAKDGLPTNSQSVGLLDDSGLVFPPAIQAWKLEEAFQLELSRTIEMIDGVVGARVHVARPEQEGILASKPDDIKATVMLVVQPGWTITQDNAAAITHIVASATPGLLPENVTITDNKGRLLSNRTAVNANLGMADSFHSLKQSIETRMNEQIGAALERHLGPGRVSILSSVVLDMTSQSVVKKTYEKGVTQQETIDSTTTTKDPVQDDKGNTKQSGTSEKTESIVSEYLNPETMTTMTDVSGKIVSWSVTAVVDLHKRSESSPDGETAAGEDTTAGGQGGQQTAVTGELIMSVEDVEEIILGAIGGRKMLTDENALTVKNVPIYEPPMSVTAVSQDFERMSRIVDLVRHSSMGVLALCALIVLRIFTKASRRIAEVPAAPESTGQLASSGLGLLPPGADPSAAYRQRIATELRQNPDQVRRLFASWLAEGN